VDRWTRSFLPAALAVIGVITFISGDLRGDHRIRVEGGGIIGAAILMAIAGGALRRLTRSLALTHTTLRAARLIE